MNGQRGGGDGQTNRPTDKQNYQLYSLHSVSTVRSMITLCLNDTLYFNLFFSRLPVRPYAHQSCHYIAIAKLVLNFCWNYVTNCHRN